MADIRDEHGRPIQLTDQHGQPVRLTDEHGVPMHLTGVATTVGSTPQGHTTIGSELHHMSHNDDQATMGSETHGGTHFAPTPVDYAKQCVGAVSGTGAGVATVTGGGTPTSHTQPHYSAGTDKKELERLSSSSSSEDDGQGGRRKKKGIMQKIKDKLPGHHNSSSEQEEKQAAAAAAHSVSTQEHEKKGFMDKIKDRLPGHH